MLSTNQRGGCENGKWTDLVAVGNFEDDKVTALAGWTADK